MKYFSIVFWSLWVFSVACAQEKILFGIDVLEKQHFKILSGKRIGLICNTSSVNKKGTPSFEIMMKSGVNLRALFAPEHGFLVNEEAGRYIKGQYTYKGVLVYSLYNKNKAPTKAQLKDLDMLIFDMQDVGVRVFTYISTMRHCMKAAYKSNKSFVVLDRPNPLSFYGTDGFLLDTNFRSFVGAMPIPFIHGMTVGEIASFIKKTEMPKIDLLVVKTKGYNRKKFFDEHQIKHFSPSPNLPKPESIICYPITVLLEATNVSEGRGTVSPFQIIGTPFINPEKLIQALPKKYFSGINIKPVLFKPLPIKGKVSHPKYENKQCAGVRLCIQKRKLIKPFKAAIALLSTLKKLYPYQFKITNESFFDFLAGTDLLRKALDENESVENIIKSYQESLKEWNK